MISLVKSKTGRFFLETTFSIFLFNLFSYSAEVLSGELNMMYLLLCYHINTLARRRCSAQIICGYSLEGQVLCKPRSESIKLY